MYLSYKKLPHSTNLIQNSLSYHRNKLKLRLYNTNPPLASVPALYNYNIQLQLQNYENVKPLRVDYIKGKTTKNNKIDLIIDLTQEWQINPNYTIELLKLAKPKIPAEIYTQLFSYCKGLK